MKINDNVNNNLAIQFLDEFAFLWEQKTSNSFWQRILYWSQTKEKGMVMCSFDSWWSVYVCYNIIFKWKPVYSAICCCCFCGRGV